MTVFMLANVGNRDVMVGKEAPVPGEAHPAWNPQASRRTLGQALMADWAGCAPHLSLPIIGKAADFVRKEAGQINRVILISSDQSAQDGVADRYLAQDTCELAPVVERLLVERHGVADGAVEHWTVTTNPADYGEMQSFFRQRLPGLRADHPDATFYLQVSGGTPAMTSMLLTVGAETFGLAAHPLYVSEREEQPFPLDLGRRAVADALIRALRADVALYAYHAAARTVRDSADLLNEFLPLEPLLGVLEYAHQRRNFDFDDAADTIERIADPVWRERALGTAIGLGKHERAWLLSENIHNVETAYELGHLFDFVTRVFQFVEGALRFLALDLGVQFVDKRDRPNKDGEKIAPAWQQQYQTLVEDMARSGVDVAYGANRTVLAAIAERLCTRQDDAPRRQALEALKKLEQVGNLRNRVVHRYHAVTLALIRDTYYPSKRDRKRHPPEETAEEIIAVMKTVWSAVAGRPFAAANPYTAINQLILEILNV